jgi:hypothetical protein
MIESRGWAVGDDDGYRQRRWAEVLRRRRWLDGFSGAPPALAAPRKKKFTVLLRLVQGRNPVNAANVL